LSHYQKFYLMNGALIYWGFKTKQRKTSLLDMTPLSKAGVQDAPLLIGRTFSDTEAGIHITPIGKGGTNPESLDVVVNIGKFPDNAPPKLKIIAEATSVGRGQMVSFKTEAGDADSDTLAYSWESSDGDVGGNITETTRSWTAAGRYQIRCTVSDMKGGIAIDTIEIAVK